MNDLPSLERRTIERAAQTELRILRALDQATSGTPVGGTTRSAAETNLLYQSKDPKFIARIQASKPYMTADEIAQENARSMKAGYKVIQ